MATTPDEPRRRPMFRVTFEFTDWSEPGATLDLDRLAMAMMAVIGHAEYPTDLDQFTIDGYEVDP